MSKHNTWCKNLQVIRTSKNFTQKTLALRTKVSEKTIKDLELGLGNPTLGTLDKLADVLECTANDLTGASCESRDAEIANVVRFKLVPVLKEILALVDDVA